MASHMDATEYYAYDFFLRQTVEPLRSITPSKEWVQLALQTSIDTKAVMTAIAAVGAAHRSHSHISHASLAGLIMPEDQTATMHLYGRAVAALQIQIDAVVERKATLEPVLLACLLLVCYEVLLARDQQAVAHCRLGWNIIRKSCCGGNSITKDSIPAHSQAAIGFLVDAFRKLGGETLAISQDFLGPDSPTAEHSLAMPEVVWKLQSKLNDLIEHGDELLEELRQLAKRHLETSYGEGLDTDTRYCLTYCLSRAIPLSPESGLERRLQAALKAHDSWLATYGFQSERNSAPLPREFIMLRIRHLTSYFSLATCRETFEMPTDRFENEFLEILDLVDEYLARDGYPSTEPSPCPDFTPKPNAGVSLEVGIIPALRLVAYKSRTSHIRHRALDILFASRRREGLMWGPVVATIASSVVEYEEEAARSLMPESSPTTKDLNCEQVPEQVRFADVITHGMRGNRVMIKLVCARYAHESDGTVHITKLEGYGRPSNTQTNGRSFFDVRTIDNLIWGNNSHSGAT